MKLLHLSVLVGMMVLLLVAAKPEGRSNGRAGGGAAVEPAVTPSYWYNVWLCRLGATSVTANVIGWKDMEVSVSFGENRETMTQRTQKVKLAAGETQNLVIDQLKPDTGYFYQVSGSVGGGELLKGEIRGFHTQRSKASAFTFAIQAVARGAQRNMATRE